MTAAPSNLPLAEAPALIEPPGTLVIQPQRGWIPVDWQELLRYRELLFFLVWRDIKVRYKQAVLGSAWAVIQPLLTAGISALIFGKALGLGKDLPVPMLIYVFAGLLPWQFFNSAVSIGGSVLINQQHLLTKIYFPRLFLPTAAVGANLLDMIIAQTVLLIIMLSMGIIPSAGVLVIPLLYVLTIVMSLGFVYFLAAITVMYRDFKFITPFMLQIMGLVSFVQFPLDEALLDKHPALGWVLSINPVFGVVNAFRAAIIGTGSRIKWHPEYLAISIIVSIIMFLLGMFYFRKTERRFADFA